MSSKMVGSHVWFFREGDAFTVPAPGTCGVDDKPGIDPDFDTGWIEMGAIETFEPTIAQEEYKLWKPNPGTLVLKDYLENKVEMSLKFTTNDFNMISAELFYRTSQKLTLAQTQFNPLSSPSKRGWLHMQQYDHNNDLIITMDLFVRLRCAALKADGTPSKPDFEAYVFANDLNTGVHGLDE